MRIRVIDGVPHVRRGAEAGDDFIVVGGTIWRPLDDRPEDREAREAWEEFAKDKEVCLSGHVERGGYPCVTSGGVDGLYELVEEHVVRGEPFREGRSRKTLRRVEE